MPTAPKRRRADPPKPPRLFTCLECGGVYRSAAGRARHRYCVHEPPPRRAQSQRQQSGLSGPPAGPTFSGGCTITDPCGGVLHCVHEFWTHEIHACLNGHHFVMIRTG